MEGVEDLPGSGAVLLMPVYMLDTDIVSYI